MEKTRTTIWIDPTIHRQLKILAAKMGKPLGDVIGILFHYHGILKAVKEPAVKELLGAALEQAKLWAEEDKTPDDEWTN